VGEPSWDEHTNNGTITVAVPVKRFDGTPDWRIPAEVKSSRRCATDGSNCQRQRRRDLLDDTEGQMLASSREAYARG